MLKIQKFAGQQLLKMASFTTAANNKLKGKVAVVTASTDGIGYAIAERLAADGASVVVSSRKEQNVNNAVQKLKANGYSVSGVVCHVGKAADREKLFKEAQDKFGGIDILVSNAAVNPGVGPVLESPEDVWDKVFDINVKAAYLLSKEALPHLRKRSGGSIVYVSSIAGFQPFELLGVYSVSKTALLGLTKAASKDLARENIRVNCLAPGIVVTRFSSAKTQTCLSQKWLSISRKVLNQEPSDYKRSNSPQNPAQRSSRLHPWTLYPQGCDPQTPLLSRTRKKRWWTTPPHPSFRGSVIHLPPLKT